MTNLFLNDNRTIAMDNWQQTPSGLSKTNKAETLGKLRPVFFQYFEPLVDDCCMRIDLEFGLQLGKNREKISKDQYIKLLEYLRSARRDIAQNYLCKVNEIFDRSSQKTAANPRSRVNFSDISLMNHDVVRENHVLAQITRDCEHLFYEELTVLNKYIALQHSKQTIADSENPIFPEKLIRALVEVVEPLKLNADGRIALYKTFEASVFNRLGFIYNELITWCKTAAPAKLYVVGEIKEQAEPIAESVEQPSAEFVRLQEKLELWRSDHSAYGLISVSQGIGYEHFEIKNALQILQQFGEDSASGKKPLPLKWRVLEKLEELSFSVDVKSFAKADEDVLDLVALVFRAIARNKLLDDTVKKNILSLEIPVATVSLGRFGVFTNQDSPVRRLLDDLFAAGIFLNADEYDDRLVQERIANAIKKMTQNSSCELSAWITEADEFSVYLGKQNQRSRHAEQNIKQVMNSRQAQASSRKGAAIAIENSMKNKAIPTAIAEFLRDVWSAVLLDAYTGKEERPEQWDKLVRAMDELIISVIPPTDDNERKQILKLLPGLIAELRAGLKQISYDKSAQSRFFKDLAVWHIILMDKKGKTAGDIDNAVAVEDEHIKVEQIADDSSRQAENLALESWVAFTTESGRQWGKLLCKDALTEGLLFVGKNGVTIFEIQAAELAAKLRSGLAAVVKINEKPITERVISELVSL